VSPFREHFGSRTRLDTLKQMAATLGAAGLLYFVAFSIEAASRTDVTRGLAFEAEQRAAIVDEVPGGPSYGFPMQSVLIAIAVAAAVVALARPVRPREGGEGAAPGRTPRRHAVGVAGAALVCAVTITLLVRV
jgi:hypothetical protein